MCNCFVSLVDLQLNLNEDMCRGMFFKGLERMCLQDQCIPYVILLISVLSKTDSLFLFSSSGVLEI